MRAALFIVLLPLLALSGTLKTDSLAPGPVSRIQDEGVNLTRRGTLNFVGSAVTCVDDPVGKRSTCTVTGGSGVSQVAVSGGYMTRITGGISSADTTNPSIQLCNANDLAAGATAVNVYQNANCTSPVFTLYYDGGIISNGNFVFNHQLQRAGGTIGIYGGGRVRIYGTDPDGAAAIGTVIDTNTVPYTTVGAELTEFQNNSVRKFAVGKNGQPRWPTGNADSVQGTATLSTGVVTVTTTAVSANSKIHLTMNTPGGTAIGVPFAKTADIVAGTSFVIRSFAPGGTTAELGDNSTVNWLITDQ